MYCTRCGKPLARVSLRCPECRRVTPAARYILTAVPLETAAGAQRVYCTNETGAIHYSDDGKEQTCLQKLAVPK